MAVVSRIDYHRWIPLAVPGYLLSILLGVAVLLFGEEYNGSKKMAVFGPGFLSAFRICKGSGDLYFFHG